MNTKKKRNPYAGFDDADVSKAQHNRQYLRHHGKYLLRLLELREDQQPEDADPYVAATVQVLHVYKGGLKRVTKDAEVVEDDQVETLDVREFYWKTGGKYSKLGWRDAKLFVMAAAGVAPTSQEASQINGAFFAVAAGPDQPLRGEYLICEQVLGVKGKRSEHAGDPKIDTYCRAVPADQIEAIKARFDGVPMPELEKHDDEDDEDDDSDDDVESDNTGGDVPSAGGDDDIPF